MKKIHLTVIVPVLVFLCAPSAEGSSREDGFPMSVGTYWVYEGPVKWNVPGSPDVAEDTITWRMEIVKTFERDGIAAARVKGHPGDLAWYDENRQPGDYLIARTSEDKYYLVNASRVDNIMKRLLDENDSLDGLFDKTELFLDLPLSINKTFGGLDGGYHWQVIEVDSLDSWLIRELPLPHFTRYRLGLVTLPDHTIVDFVPGVGITGYTYIHHGTVSEVNVKLVGFQTGGNDE